MRFELWYASVPTRTWLEVHCGEIPFAFVCFRLHVIPRLGLPHRRCLRSCIFAILYIQYIYHISWDALLRTPLDSDVREGAHTHRSRPGAFDAVIAYGLSMLRHKTTSHKTAALPCYRVCLSGVREGQYKRPSLAIMNDSTQYSPMALDAFVSLPDFFIRLSPTTSCIFDTR